jgi:hypothetical protein
MDFNGNTNSSGSTTSKNVLVKDSDVEQNMKSDLNIKDGDLETKNIVLTPSSLPSESDREEGMLYFDSVTKQLKLWNGQNWIGFIYTIL